MAKKTEEALAVRGSVEGEALATFSATQGYDSSDVRGKEGITKEDLKLPFMSVAQKTSAALDATSDACIDGLKFGDIYDPSTNQIYGNGRDEKIYFQALRMRKRAYLPLENGRMGEEIDWNDPRTSWDEARKASLDKPEGVKVYDWVILIEGELFPKVLSFKSASFSAGQSLATFISMVPGPAFTARFSLSTQLKENPKGKFAVLVVKPAGKPSAEQLQTAETIYESIKDRTIVVEDTEPEVATSAPAAANEKVPF